MDVKEVFYEFSVILSEDAIVERAKEYGVEDKRKRKLTVVPFFWLMVLSAVESAPRGCLSKLVALFTASFSPIYPGNQVPGLSRMALSKKLSRTNWMFFRGVYNNCSSAISTRSSLMRDYYSRDSKTASLWMEALYGSIRSLKRYLKARLNHKPR